MQRRWLTTSKALTWGEGGGTPRGKSIDLQMQTSCVWVAAVCGLGWDVHKLHNVEGLLQLQTNFLWMQQTESGFLE